MVMPMDFTSKLKCNHRICFNALGAKSTLVNSYLIKLILA
jgi:hypothetical protein